ncbi:MAG: UDP-N-acetylmuramoyl-L-alanyl-D-glutamate--2,6-diaminopimelate ligase [Bacteroidetes bacterium]|nr:UDP-N-acetylmuramoyl-L-alanyl-D-glutamate--2,6-diaminopimelate ligase [Bacteroidota bacterium]
MQKALKDILKNISVLNLTGPVDRMIKGIGFDSRIVKPGSLFAAVRGSSSDGHNYITQALEKGAVVIVCEEFPHQISTNITYIQVENSAMALGILASNYYDHPSGKLKLIGVTGTNGKTTTVTLLFKIFREFGYHAGMISTIHNQIDDAIVSSSHTTPDAIELNNLLSKMVNKGCRFCFMEVSSHAIVQNRIAGIEFSGGLFTNITHDHLDYHKTFVDYIGAKKAFFDGLPGHAFALTNADDKNGSLMLQNTCALKYTYGLKSPADFKCRIVENQFEGLLLNIDREETWFRLTGQFNAYNILAVYGTAFLLGEEKKHILTVLSNQTSVEGRFDYMRSPDDIIAIVDYAHTPDALSNVLDTIHAIRRGQGKLITVVGAGGDRDKAKRPVMGRIACSKSDRVIFTSDNPRSEEQEQIIREMTSDLEVYHLRRTIVVVDRREAIKTACAMASPGDIILVAGKGHEKYQEIKGIRYPFDDKRVLQDILMPATDN